MRIAKGAAAGVIMLAIASCADDPLKGLVPGTGPAVTDAELHLLMQPGAGWAFFRNSATPIVRSSDPHPPTHALVRYNARAATQLDANGRVRPNASFPDSSIIVKELSDGVTVAHYSVMMKLRGSSSAGFDGWIWAAFSASGAVEYSTAGRGGACSSCHSSGIDYTRMNDSHP